LLADSFGRQVGTDGHDLTALRADRARFSFLLGHDDGAQLFGHDDGEQLHGVKTWAACPRRVWLVGRSIRSAPAAGVAGETLPAAVFGAVGGQPGGQALSGQSLDHLGQRRGVRCVQIAAASSYDGEDLGEGYVLGDVGIHP